jgi:hypothetical protein
MASLQLRRAQPFINAVMRLDPPVWFLTDAYTENDPSRFFNEECVQQNWRRVLDALRGRINSRLRGGTVYIDPQPPTRKILAELGILDEIMSLRTPE